MRVNDRTATLLRSARQRAGMTQTQLANAAGVAQPVVSQYETGTREPAFSTLERLVAATGSTLELRTHSRSTGPARRALDAHRDQLRALLTTHGLRNARVFGSVARGDDHEQSDLDVVAIVPPSMGAVGLLHVRAEAARLLGVSVDIVPERDLAPGILRDVTRDAIAL